MLNAEYLGELAGVHEVTFSQFMQILSKFRLREGQLQQRVFEAHDANDSGGLSRLECQRALQACDIVPRNLEEAQEIVSLIDEFNVNGSGELCLQEFLQLARVAVVKLQKIR